ncbi:MAG: thiazole synthase [Planctomycetota bacterium]|nr:MAG: thiazole synthase [Planctomycetota bacterium]
MNNDALLINQIEYSSRLILGTGKYPSNEIMAESIKVSKTSMVTVALRRVDTNTSHENIIQYIDTNTVSLLPNTSGAVNAEEAIRLAKLGRSAGLGDLIKLEITPDPRSLLPDGIETFKACEVLVKEGFTVMPYINADPILARNLEDAGASTVMPLGSPIGTNRGLETKESIRLIIENASIPVIVDAGIGAPSHAAEAMEMGADAVMVNTAIASAKDPIKMSVAFQMAVESGRMAYLSGLGKISTDAIASSPLTGFLGQVNSNV